MDINWLEQIDMPINKSDKTQYQILMTLMRIEILLNRLMPTDTQETIEECTITEISSVDYSNMTKEELMLECEKQGIKINTRDSKTKLIEKLSE